MFNTDEYNATLPTLRSGKTAKPTNKFNRICRGLVGQLFTSSFQQFCSTFNENNQVYDNKIFYPNLGGSKILRFLIVVQWLRTKLKTSSVLPIYELHLYVSVSLFLFSTKEVNVLIYVRFRASIVYCV